MINDRDHTLDGSRLCSPSRVILFVAEGSKSCESGRVDLELTGGYGPIGVSG